ncbi:MAG: GNAT family N-acetyltransferase, partial [Bacillota bacterium]
MAPVLLPLMADDPRLTVILEEIRRVVYSLPHLDHQRALHSLSEALRRSEGLVLYQDGLIVALILYYSRGATGRITFAYAMERFSPQQCTSRLVREAVHRLAHRIGVTVLRCDFSPWGPDYLSWALLDAGFHSVQRAAMRAEAPFVVSTALPHGAELVDWQPDLMETAAHLLQASFGDELDGRKDPAFRDTSGCRQLIAETCQGRFGIFDPEVSTLLRYHSEWVGLALGSWTPAGDGFIPAIGLIPDARGLGLGKTLLSELLKRFAYASAPAVELAVTLDNKP